MMVRLTPLAAALVGLVSAGAASAADSPVGDWITEGNKARVKIAPCAGSPDELCGVITWAYRPPDAPATGPLLDIHNKDAKLRTRPIEGLPLIQGFKPAGPGKWDGGTIYDPEGGKTYKSKMNLVSPDRLEVDGCVLFICQTQHWQRIQG